MNIPITFFNTNDIIEATGYELQYDSNISVIQTAMKYKNKETICDLEIIFVISNDSHKIILQIQKEFLLFYIIYYFISLFLAKLKLIVPIITKIILYVIKF